MTSSTSSSTRSAALAAILLVLAACASGRGARRPGGAVERVALLPPDNRTGVGVATGELTARIAAALARAGLEVVTGDAVVDFMRAHRVRSTSGLSGEVAAAARRELGVDALALTTLATYDLRDPPSIELVMRLVTADQVPVILWMDGISMSGDEDPGPLRLWVVHRMPKLEAKALDRLGGALEAFLRGKGPRVRACRAEARFRPVVSFMSPTFELGAGAPVVGVMPFVNSTERDDAGDLLQVEFTRQFLAAGFDAVEPGRIRRTLLDYRIIQQGGLASTQATTLRQLMGVDYLLTGSVLDYSEPKFGRAATVRFSVDLLDARDGTIVWSATSYHHGDDGVVLFNLGLVRNVAALACLMASSAVAEAQGQRALSGMVSR